jgi:hypothetical protein
MSNSPKIISPLGEELSALPEVPPLEAVHPYGSKVLIEDLRPEEILNTKMFVPEKANCGDHAPQAYIVELGPRVPEEAGLEVGQRVFWSGTGVPVKDPRQSQRIRALIEIHQIIAIAEEGSTSKLEL